MNEHPTQDYDYRHLARHFGWLNRPVDCDAARLFLPLMTTASFQVRTRTPITAHCEACPACRSDLRRLRQMHLSDAQRVEVCRLLAGDGTACGGLSPAAKQTLEGIARRTASGKMEIYYLKSA